MGYAFISYSSEQQKDADSLRFLLHTNHIDTWMVPYDIPDGSEYSDVINHTIQNAACIVLLLTEEAQNSIYVDKEIERALHYGKTIAPIQLGSMVLNDSFSFYLCNQQIVTVPAIDASSPKMQNMLRHLQFLCNDRLPDRETPVDAARDRRVNRQKISRLCIGFGIALFYVSLVCGNRYVSFAARGTYEEMYGGKHIPDMPEIALFYLLFFIMAVAAVLVCLYGWGLKDPRKKTWNPLQVILRHQLLPAFAAVCANACAMLYYARQTVAEIAWGLEAYRHSAEAYVLSQWVVPATWTVGIVAAAAALLSVVCSVLYDRRNGFAFVRKTRREFRSFLTRRKRG